LLVRGLEFPDDLYYLVEHQVWARLEGDGLARVGITSLGVRLSGEIYMCRAQEVGSAVEQGRSVAVVELAKAIVSVKSPVSGQVVQTNSKLVETPELVHLDPYGEGWIALLRARDFARDTQGLVHGAAVAGAMEHHAWLNQLE
jgi:glycine cleavage system H protein